MLGVCRCDISTPVENIATLLEANCPDISRITLDFECVEHLFSAKTIKGDLKYWAVFDYVLIELAKRLRGTHDRKLVFVMRMGGWNSSVSAAKKSLPRLLPLFYDEGLLHVHGVEDDVCNGDYPNAREEGVYVSLAALEEYGYESDGSGEEAGEEWAEGNE